MTVTDRARTTPVVSPPMIVALDRDGTFDCSGGPVPLEWARRLARSTIPTYVIGNQTLCDEAGLPGVAELERRVGRITATDAAHAALSIREQRVDAVRRAHPDVDRRIVVDDVDLSHMDGWTHYLPHAFVAAVEAGEVTLPG